MNLFRKFSLEVFPFLGLGILYRNKLVNRISESPLLLGS